jgi:hypothetical protein
VRVVAAGGDGTVSWVATMLASICDDEKLPLPPLAAMPLGTGNELARNTGCVRHCSPPHALSWTGTRVMHRLTQRRDEIQPLCRLSARLVCEREVTECRCGGCRWSNTHTGNKLTDFLMHVATRRTFYLDTWTISCQPAAEEAARSEEQILCFASAGFDASIAWRFHHMRENSPSDSGNSVAANKVRQGVELVVPQHTERVVPWHIPIPSRACEQLSAGANTQAWHVWYGIDELVFPKTYVRDCLKVWVDGHEVVIPPDVNTVQIMSVPTGSDGTDYFKPGEKSQPGEMQDYSPPCMGDGLLEIVRCPPTLPRLRQHRHKCRPPKSPKVTPLPNYHPLAGASLALRAREPPKEQPLPSRSSHSARMVWRCERRRRGGETASELI